MSDVRVHLKRIFHPPEGQQDSNVTSGNRYAPLYFEITAKGPSKRLVKKRVERWVSNTLPKDGELVAFDGRDTPMTGNVIITDYVGVVKTGFVATVDEVSPRSQLGRMLEDNL